MITSDTPVYEATARALMTWPDAISAFMSLPMHIQIEAPASWLIIGHLGLYLMFSTGPTCIPLDF